jgi:hypothetical protein
MLVTRLWVSQPYSTHKQGIFSPKRSDTLWGPHSPAFEVPVFIYMEAKQPDPEAGRLLPSRAEVENKFYLLYRTTCIDLPQVILRFTIGL